ncbi:MAG TPA: adenylate/guanylate cyclase domain-containing protein, partial [Gaiellaceae bacterium]|nr:adenylate/guanylate cyclase domain-containing protein [Gaiellaceae bacterium]
ALWGSCSEPELSLPYLPFVEAIGNQLGQYDRAEVRAQLGPMSAELAQLFPQLGNGTRAGADGDPEQAKLRMFESLVTLLELWARERGLLLVLEDVHWADSSTRHLLDYVARRMANSRVMVLATYRSDELDRRHPLTRMVQVWGRTGAAEMVAVEAMTPQQVTEMIAAILDAESVSAELGSLVHARSEGNPFVLEELLREAVDRREIVRTETGWERSPLDALRLPDTVREAVLLRVGRLDPVHIEVLRAAAVLGRSFDYGLLVEVAEADEGAVLAALEAAVAQQLVEEDAQASDRYRWRHALTQEAIASDTVLPKRQRIHSRAADALEGADGSPMAIASHLLEAGRANEAVGACLRAAEEAERSVAFREAAELLERVLPHVSDPRERARLLLRIGRLRWYSGEPAAAEQLLVEAVEQLKELGLSREAAQARVYLGRSQWELDKSAEAMEQFEHALAALEREGPSADLALVHLRIAGIYAFRLEYDRCLEAAERAVEIAQQAAADFERVYALSVAALGYYGTAREFTLMDRCYHEALAKGYVIIASSLVYNEIWDRVHAVAGGFARALEKQEPLLFHIRASAGGEIARAWALIELGAPRDALGLAVRARDRHESLGARKFEWRSRIAATEALVELGRMSEADAELPPPSPANELQDIVYDTPARVRVALAHERTDEALELGRRVAAAGPVLIFPKTVALGVEALVAGGALDEAAALLKDAKRASTELGQAALAIAEGRVLLASGNAIEALPVLERALRELESSDLRLWTWQASILAAEAAAETGDDHAASSLLESCVREAHQAGAVRIRDEARAAALRLGFDPPQLAEEPEAEAAEPTVLPAGERLVTSMFADVRGYTPLASASAPEDLADRMLTLHRWAASEVGRRRGIVDKFAGDAVMATFNVAGSRVDHAVLALEAALALRDKAALMDLPVGIGIAVGPAVVSRSLDANVSVLGPATNLAARLQQAAAGGEILLSDEAFRRVASWLSERGLTAEPQELELKGFDGAQPAYRLPASVPVAG